MTKALKWSGISFAGLAVTLMLSTQAVRADSEILESSTAELKVGATIKDGARITIPNGATVRVLITSDTGNLTKTLKGPYEGRIADYKEERSWWERLTGANKDPEAPMGTTRGLKTPK